VTDLQVPPADAPGNTMSDAFVHDLRTPINHIIGFTEMLTEQAQEEGQTGFLPDLQNIYTAARQLATLLNNGVPPLPELMAVMSPIGVTEPAGIPNIPQPLPQQTVQQTPCAETEPGPVPKVAVSTEASQSGAPQALILVVDDNKVNRDVLSRRLARQGYGVAAVENGCLAMEAVRARAFDLVLLDIMMPEMDGYEVLRRLKAEETLRNIPVIMISAVGDMESVVRCIEMGADDYLPKPFAPTLLKARIGACLEKKRSRDREIGLYTELQALEKMRDDLTNMMVHDLRTPLTSVISGMQTLESTRGLDEMQQELVGMAIAGGGTLLGMINELLDVVKMESGQMQLVYAAISPGDLVASAVSQVASLTEGARLELVSQVGPALPAFQGEADKLRRTLVNLLGNAIKFTPRGGTVTVGVQPGDDGRSLLFSVGDTGEGIPAEAFGRIFEKFGQVESRRRGRKVSTGLGLTFCKLAVEAHGGSIQVESVPDKGSVFSFSIPLAPPNS
jgi:two-component system, sensor histidine kinase and response regulator